MKYDKQLSIEEHIELAKSLLITQEHLSKIFFIIQQHYPKSHILYKNLHKISLLRTGGIFTQIKSDLDNEYLKMVNDKQFKKLGFIYYPIK